MNRRSSQWIPEVWTQLALPRLGDGDDDGDRDRWSFAIVALDRHGRLTLPGPARTALAIPASLRVSTRNEAVVVRRGDGGAGRAVNVDVRGRLVVPVWLRDATRPTRSVLVATRTDETVDPVALLAPPQVLARLADRMVGER